MDLLPVDCARRPHQKTGASLPSSECDTSFGAALNSEDRLVAFLSMQRKVTQNLSPENLAKGECCYCNL